MNFNIYLEEELSQKLKIICQKTGKSRNALIKEAIREFLQKCYDDEWPEEILNFEGSPELGINFEQYRNELLLPNEAGLF